jgi:pyruvate dehydrogenase E2 component (dihydrolipoamide acetyltransferase)
MASVITMPRLSPTMEEGVLAKWTKKEGDKIAPGDVIAEVETDKANMDFPLEDEGVLLKLLVQEGQTVKLGEAVAILGEVGEDPATALAQAKQAPAPAAPETKTKAEAPPTEAPTKTISETPETKTETPILPSGDGHRMKVSPLARRIADERGVDLKGIAGSGPGGRIVKRDIEAAAAPAPAALRAVPAPPPSGKDELVTPSQMRKAIARRLVEAKREIPHIYLVAEATVDALLSLREQINELGDRGPQSAKRGAEEVPSRGEAGLKISINDLVVKALALALRRVPEANVSWTADGILRHGRVDVGVAVSLPDGLITPVVRGADGKSLGALADEIRGLAERARQKKLKPEEYSGGSATVSNLGMFGMREFAAIINPPESVILAVGTTEKRPIVVEKNGRDEITIARRMTLTLSCDHRVVDGVLGARLLAEIVKLLERPIAMVL